MTNTKTKTLAKTSLINTSIVKVLKSPTSTNQQDTKEGSQPRVNFLWTSYTTPCPCVKVATHRTKASADKSCIFSAPYRRTSLLTSASLRTPVSSKCFTAFTSAWRYALSVDFGLSITFLSGLTAFLSGFWLSAAPSSSLVASPKASNREYHQQHRATGNVSIRLMLPLLPVVSMRFRVSLAGIRKNPFVTAEE